MSVCDRKGERDSPHHIPSSESLVSVFVTVTPEYLKYQVYYSTSNNIDTVASVKANGTPSGNLELDINTKNVINLTGLVDYYFTVLVRDVAGQEALYAVAIATTPFGLPAFSPGEGTLAKIQDITMNINPTDAKIIHTTDESDPAADSDCLASNGIQVSNGAVVSVDRHDLTIKAIGCKPVSNFSGQSSAVYSVEKIIFLTTDPTQGDFVSGGGGILGVDYLCEHDPDKPLDGQTYKALLVDGAARIAEPPFQTNWILQADTSYFRADGTTLIAKTNTGSIFDVGLSNSPTGFPAPYWTGLEPSWMSSVEDCNNWAAMNSYNGKLGSGKFTDDRWYANVPALCNEYYNLLCVER